MPNSTDLRKIASAVLLIALTGPATGQGARETAADGVRAQTVGTINPINPCPPEPQPVLRPKDFLVVNRTNATLQCRMRNPIIGGWSDFVSVSAGGRLLDRQMELDEVQIQCKPPSRIYPVRIFPRKRYAMLREPGNSDITVVEVVPGQ